MKKYADLHVHTTFSDGLLSPAEVVDLAVRKGLSAIAIADHDSVGGIDEAIEAGLKAGIEVIPAVELSVSFEAFQDVHLLGYHIDHHDGLFLKRLDDFQKRRDNRGSAILEKINAKLVQEDRLPVSGEEVAALAQGSLGRPHIARALQARGYVTGMEDAFVRYLEPCDVPKEYFAADEALAEIERLGGVSVLAHPVSITSQLGKLEGVLKELKYLGLDGVEVFSNMCSTDDIILLSACAARLGLTVTGGSDFHGPGEYADLGFIRKENRLSYTLVENVAAALRKKRAAQGI